MSTPAFGIQLSEQIRQLLPQLRLGLLTAEVKVVESPAILWHKAERLLAEKKALSAEAVRQIPALAAARQAYKALGQDPSRYRLSAEALHRRLLKGQGMYRISNVVDIINLVSLSSGFSIGGYDTRKIQGQISLQVGMPEMEYRALGRGELNISHLPVLVDQAGAFGSPTSDSVRTAIETESTQIALVFFDFGHQPELTAAMQEAVNGLHEFAAGTQFAHAFI